MIKGDRNYSNDGQDAAGFTLLSIVGIQLVDDIAQIRLGPTAIQVPEPGSMAILGGSLLLAGLVLRRRRQSQDA